MKRHEFSNTVRLNLAHRAGFCCSNPICNALTVGPSDESESSRSNFGAASHITAASCGGPRYDASLSKSDRISIDNGIWLCQVCAKKIDDDVVAFPVLLLRQWKQSAEENASRRLGVPSPFIDKQVKKLDPLDRMIAHRLRDAITLATFPIVNLLSYSVENEAAYLLSQLFVSPPNAAKGSEYADNALLLPIIDAIATEHLLEPAISAVAPAGMRWIEWILAGLSECVNQCEQTLQLYSTRGPSVLIAAFEELAQRLRSMVSILFGIALQGDGKLVSEVGRSHFRLTLKVLFKAQRTWLDFLQKYHISA